MVNYTLNWYGNQSRKDVLNMFIKNGAKAGIHLQKEITKELTKVGTGKAYKISKTGADHIASAPGEPPAVLTGHLSKSVMVEKDNENVYVGVKGVPYAKRLEFGFFGRDSLGRLYVQEPRPFFLSTFNRELENIKRIMKE